MSPMDRSHLQILTYLEGPVWTLVEPGTYAGPDLTIRWTLDGGKIVSAWGVGSLEWLGGCARTIRRVRSLQGIKARVLAATNPSDRLREIASRVPLHAVRYAVEIDGEYHAVTARGATAGCDASAYEYAKAFPEVLEKYPVRVRDFSCVMSIPRTRRNPQGYRLGDS